MHKITGITIRVRKVEESIPPATTSAMGCLLSLPIPRPSATGRIPATVEIAVISIGLRRMELASIS
jgi:hypothetical protein